jgi:hypothetical protein
MAAATAALDALTPAERLEVLAEYCEHCGEKILPCFCMNDE